MSQDGPSTKTNITELHVPTNGELISLVHRRPLISLREICAQLWPTLPWTSPRPGGDDASRVLRTYAGSFGPERLTAATWLRRRMLALVADGVLRLGPFRRGEPQEAGLTYYILGMAQAPVVAASQPDAIPALQEVIHA